MIRSRQPPVIGELLVGIAVGPHALGWVGSSEVFRAVAEVGLVFLLFQVGLENRLSDFRRIGGTATAVAVSGVVVPFAVGFAALEAFGHPTPESLFVGAALVATSVAITARVIADLGVGATRDARTILGAAVVDDVLGLLVLAIVVGTTIGGFRAREVVVLLMEATVFLGLVAALGPRLARRLGPQLNRLRLTDGHFVVGIVVCLGLAALAEYIGLAAIVGAFLAGMVFAETREHYDMSGRIIPVTNFLTPFFFVLTGMAVDPRILASRSALALTGVVFALAVAGKFVPCSLAAWRLGRRSRSIVGIGMVPRGEVGVIVASLGLSSGAVGDDVYGVIVVMSVLTSMLAAPVLRMLFRDRVASSSV